MPQIDETRWQESAEPIAVSQDTHYISVPTATFEAQSGRHCRGLGQRGQENVHTEPTTSSSTDFRIFKLVALV